MITHCSGQNLICTALPYLSNPFINDTLCNTTCFAAGQSANSQLVAVYCTPLAGPSQICQCNFPPIDCQGTLGPFGDCTVSCGGGTQTATFTVTTPAQNGGAPCQYADQAIVVQTCNPQSCPSTGFLCLAVPNTGANDDWCAVNCWPPGLDNSLKTFANAAPACTSVGGKSQVCICNTIVDPSVQCLAIPGNTATDDWCARNCWVSGTVHTLSNLVNYCTTAGGNSQVCQCDQYGP